jgi:hypothetical protein
MSKKKNTISPFANEADALGIGGLSIENRLDRISIYGSLDITRDREGLDHAERLKSLIDDIVATMKGEHLPASISIKPPEQISNPFADEGGF